MIDPQIWESAFDKGWTTTELSVMIAAISSADDEGRGRLSSIKRNLSGMVSEKILEKSLKKLEDSVKIYDKIYFFLPNFLEYQTINHPKPSKYPSPTVNNNNNLAENSTVSVPTKDGRTTDFGYASKVKLSKVKLSKEKKRAASLPDAGAKGSDFIFQLLKIFSDEFEKSRQTEFNILYPGKERKAIGMILRNYILKNKASPKTSDETKTDFRNYFKACLKIDDKWHFDNMCPSHIASKYNEINSILRKNGTHKKTYQSEIYLEGGANPSNTYTTINPEGESCG